MENTVELDKPQTIMWRLPVVRVCWITKDTDTHSEYVITVAFPLQQWLYECASMSCNKHIACHIQAITNICAESVCQFPSSAFVNKQICD
jgi:hypothetical protein